MTRSQLTNLRLQAIRTNHRAHLARAVRIDNRRSRTDHRLSITAVVGGYAAECACGRWWMCALIGEDDEANKKPIRNRKRN